MGEGDAIELEYAQIIDRNGRCRLGIGRCAQDLLEVRERRLRLPIDVDHVSHLLQRPEDEERIDEEREELPDGDLLREDQVEHQQQDHRAHEVDGRALHEAEAADVAHLPQLELEDLLRRRGEPGDFLVGEPEALHELDVAQRFRRRTRQRGGFGNDLLLEHLDLAAEHRAQSAEDWDRREVGWGDRPVCVEGVNHHEHDADERGEHDVHEGGDETLDVRSHLLKLAERLAAPLILEDLEWERERVADAVGVQIYADTLRGDVDEIVLEVLRDAGDEGDADRRREQQPDSAEELARGVLAELGGVVVDNVPEDQRVEQRKDLIDRGKNEGKDDDAPVPAEVAKQKAHGL